MGCPQCGNEATDFIEGVCAGCFQENQLALNQHNAEYDRWQRLTTAQRDEEIRRAGEQI